MLEETGGKNLHDEAKQAKLYAALAKAQGKFGAIEKNREVTIRPREGAAYGFRYADLEELVAKTRPALAENGLAVVQSVGMDPQGQGYLDTVVVHADGGSIHSRMPVPNFNKVEDPKRFGAALTYLRRYQYAAILCLAADDDLDEDGRDVRDEPRKESKPRPQEPRAKAAPEKSEGPVLATDGERAWTKKKIDAAGVDMVALFERHGVKVIDEMTKDQFAAIKSELLS